MFFVVFITTAVFFSVMSQHIYSHVCCTHVEVDMTLHVGASEQVAFYLADELINQSKDWVGHHQHPNPKCNVFVRNLLMGPERKRNGPNNSSDS